MGVETTELGMRRVIQRHLLMETQHHFQRKHQNGYWTGSGTCVGWPIPDGSCSLRLARVGADADSTDFGNQPIASKTGSLPRSQTTGPYKSIQHTPYCWSHRRGPSDGWVDSLRHHSQ